MRMLSIRVLVALACCTLPLAAQHEAGADGRSKHPAMGDAKAIAAGQKLYATSCTGCHGATAEGGRGPNLRQRGMWHPLDDDALFGTIKRGVPGADMPGLNLPDEQVWQIAAFVRSLTAPAIDTHVPGDTAAGESVFWGKAKCGSCHAVRGKGGTFGPDLGNVASMKAAEDIRAAIVDPTGDGFGRYRGVTVKLKSGRSLKGLARNHNNYSIQVQQPDGNLELLHMGDVEVLVFSKTSLMPGDFRERLTKEELDNLVAYLSRQSVRTAVK
ncbi:MAG: c-type cytochrome [Bryobacterales bacterium]|nr:c-type cytochrome [Bryobacterales bacterium]